ncbi:MAG: nicotinate-nucleotide diphosphorylase (carboxylating), partial [Gammaproteobacteria bacterium]|nr:nicotinate-nucleotide diphosphorylase (carboxylating) [Gammaproteobacteria bacterium]
MSSNHILPSDIAPTVANALREDIGPGDITALLIAEDTLATAHIFSREPAILCGVAWVNEVMRQVDPAISIDWHAVDGNMVDK